MNTITRRTALAGAAALPLLPVSAFALPAERNPVVAAFREPEPSFDYDACRVRLRAVTTDAAMLDSFDRMAPVYTRLGAVEHRIAEMVATTPAGLAAQARIALERFGLDGESGMEEIEGRLLRSMLDGAEGMAGVAS